LVRTSVDRPLLVALDLPLRTGDAAFTFAAGAAAGAPRGTGVIVPFGHRLMPGVILGDGPPRPDLKPVLAAVAAPLLPGPVVDRAEWLASEYLSSVGEAIAATVPWDALWAGLRIRVDGPIPSGLPPAVVTLLESVRRRPLALAAAWRRLAGGGVLEAAASSGVLTAVAAPAFPVAEPARSNLLAPFGRIDALPPYRHRERAAASKAAASKMETVMAEALGGGPRSLLVAGWNRTAAYLAAVRHARDAGWSCVAGFASVDAAMAFGAAAQAAGLAPVMLHADQKAAHRLAAWHAAAGVSRALVVGTRVAVFAPARDPVLAIVDDEDSGGHKEERAPRYVTAAAAAERTRAQGILVIGATTPSVATYAAVDDSRLRLVALPSPRPRIGVVDLRRRADRDAPLSGAVIDAVRRIARRRGRVIVLADRKGYAGGLHCLECGAVARCPRCAVAMRYDRAGRRLRCGICGMTTPAPAVCPTCGAPRLAPLGSGTERIAAALRRLTPAVWRFDSDVATTRTAAGVLAPFRGRGGVLVATQAILPYIEALHPDLVAVASADRMLHRPEFRAAERALALLRTIGIASRTAVLVETADPAHVAIRAALAPSLKSFYADELTQRRALGYPPARSLLRVTVTARSAALIEGVGARLAEGSSPALEVLGPTMRPGRPRRGTRRTSASRDPMTAVQAEFVIKAADRAAARALVRPLLRNPDRGVDLAADLDPHEL